MTVHRISSVLNKQVLHETLAIFWTGLLFIFIYFSTSGNAPVLLKLRQSAASPHRFPETRRRSEMPCVLLCFFYIVIREKYVLQFPRGLPGTVSQCEKAPWGCLGQFSFNRVVFFFLYCNHSALLLHWFPSCSSAAVSEVKCRKSVAEQLRNKQPIMASMRNSWIHLSL